MHTSHPTGSLQELSDAFSGSSRTPLIVFSHLRWGFVFQRPQHLLTRLASQFQVFFVEEPVRAEGEPGLVSALQQEGVEVLTPRTEVAAPGFHDEQMPMLKRLLADFVRARGIADPIVWLYTPMALPLVAGLDPLALVYDCMDDLASFKFAPSQLVERETSLMQLADVVLTGGPSLYEARKGRHPNLHCLPSAVDSAHFAPANLDTQCAQSAAAQALHDGMAHPRIGFFGVIDERLDLELLAGIADLRPDWQLVMVGPVVKIDPATLPDRSNIRWLGMQRYEALPHLTAQWDVCLLPFALNEATRFISPTKTLEYLAAGKPVVSTPIRDVISLYGAAVRIGSTAEEFVEGIQAALDEPSADKADWRMRAQALVDGCSWEGTADTVAGLLSEFLPRPAPAIVLAEPLDAITSRIVAHDEASPLLPVPGSAETEDQAARPLSA